MIRSCLLVATCLSLSPLFSKAQDPDMPDFRSKRESVLKMTEKDIQSDLSTFTMAGIDLFAGQPKLKSIPVASHDNSQITLEEEDLKVQVTAARFDPSKHKLNYIEKYLIKIDGRGYYGGYGTVPKTSVSGVTLITGNDTIVLPPAAYADLHNPEFTYTDNKGQLSSYVSVYRSGDKRKLYIYLLKREPTGSYEVTWVIQDKKYLRRIVDFGFLKQ